MTRSMIIGRMVPAILFCLVVLSANAAAEEPPEEPVVVSFTGFMRDFDGFSAIEGQRDPIGPILEGDHGYGRLYLRAGEGIREGSLSVMVGVPVRVRGTLGKISGRSIEGPPEEFDVLYVTVMRLDEDFIWRLLRAGRLVVRLDAALGILLVIGVLWGRRIYRRKQQRTHEWLIQKSQEPPGGAEL